MSGRLPLSPRFLNAIAKLAASGSRGFHRVVARSTSAPGKRNFPDPAAATFSPRGQLPYCASEAGSRCRKPTPAVWPHSASAVVAAQRFRAAHRSCAIRPERAEFFEASVSIAAPCPERGLGKKALIACCKRRLPDANVMDGFRIRVRAYLRRQRDKLLHPFSEQRASARRIVIESASPAPGGAGGGQ